MPLTSFCGLLTLQVGCSVLAAVFLTLASIILVANLFDYQSEEAMPVSVILVSIFAVGLIIAGLFIFFSSYNDSRTLALVAMVMVLLLLLFWLVLCIFSFVSNPDYVDKVCVHRRCPETFWFANLYYRSDDDVPNEGSKSNSSQSSANKTRRSINLLQMHLNEGLMLGLKNAESANFVGKEIDKSLMNWLNASLTEKDNVPILKTSNRSVNETKSDDAGDDDGESRYRTGTHFFAAIALFVINFLFLIYTAVILWSWAQELDWMDYYLEDEVYYY